MPKHVKRILHVIETAEPGGAETILVEIAASLPSHFTSLGCVFQEGWTSNELAKRGIPITSHPLHTAFDVSWPIWLKRFIQKNDIDLIHSHEFGANSYCAVGARLAGIPIVCTVHGKNYYTERLYRRLSYRWVARTAGAFVAVSQDIKNFLCERVGVGPDRITVIPNGVDIQRCQQGRLVREQTRCALGLETNTVAVVIVAALFQLKGHRDLLHAIAQVVQAKPHIMLLVAGEGPESGSLKALARELGLGHHVRFLGHRADVPELLGASDLFVLPSYSEGMPLSVLEAMGAGLPVVVTSIGGMPEIVVAGETGYLVAPGNIVDLATAINDLANDMSRCNRMGQSGRMRVAQEFDRKIMMRRYEGLYTRLLLKRETIAHVI